MTDHDQHVERARSETIEAFGEVADEFGLRTSWGRVYAIVYLANGSVTFGKLVDESGCSRVAVNDALEGLAQLELVEVESTAASDDGYLEARQKEELARATQTVLPEKLQAESRLQRKNLQEAEEIYRDEPEDAEYRTKEEKVREVREYFDDMLDWMSWYETYRDSVPSTVGNLYKRLSIRFFS